MMRVARTSTGAAALRADRRIIRLIGSSCGNLQLGDQVVVRRETMSELAADTRNVADHATEYDIAINTQGVAAQHLQRVVEPRCLPGPPSADLVSATVNVADVGHLRVRGETRGHLDQI